jgi:hypothetical protein
VEHRNGRCLETTSSMQNTTPPPQIATLPFVAVSLWLWLITI